MGGAEKIEIEQRNKVNCRLMEAKDKKLRWIGTGVGRLCCPVWAIGRLVWQDPVEQTSIFGDMHVKSFSTSLVLESRKQ
jgi:hypothetical protein